MPNTKKYLSIAGLEHYDDKIKKVISDSDAAALQAAKDYADSLASNYDQAGAAATAEANAKAHADAEVAKANAAAAAAQAQADKGVADAAAADAKAVAAQGEVDALETYVGTIPSVDGTPVAESVVAYVDKKTSGIATDTALSELTARVGQAETDIDNIEKDYLKSADKTELQGAIDTVSSAVETEKGRAEGVEAGLESRLAAVEGDYLKSADKTELQGAIDTVSGAVKLLTNGVDAEKVDGVNDLIQYVEEHGTEVTGMKTDISNNAAAITAEETRAKAEEAKNAQAAATAQAAAEAAAAAVVTEQGRAEGVEQGLDTRLQAVEAKFGEGDGNVEDMIATAKQEAIDAAALDATSKANTAESNAKGYTDGEIDKVEATIAEIQAASATHALASDLTALAGRVTTAEGEIDTLQSEMDAVEALAAANKTAHEANAAAIALKAAQSDLDAAVARIAANEAEIASFAAIENSEIDAMFA